MRGTGGREIRGAEAPREETGGRNSNYWAIGTVLFGLAVAVPPTGVILM